MYDLKSNFYPAQEPKEGYIGKANITIANAFRINNISVFQKDDGYSISFAGYGDTERNNSYVIPKSKEAYAAMLGVVVKAVEADQHYAFENGEYGPKLTVTGHRVTEPYADGRFSVQIGDLCTLNGITTRWVEFAKDGKDLGFVGVDMPVVRDSDGKVRMYTNAEGKNVADLQFEGLVSKWKDKEGKDQKLDWGQKLADAVKKERGKLYLQSLDSQVSEAQEKADAAAKETHAPQKSNDEIAR